METWEVELREKLDKEVQDGIYDIGIPGYSTYTGKGGYIDYLVELHRQTKLINPAPLSSEDYNKFKKTLEEYFYGNKSS